MNRSAVNNIVSCLHEDAHYLTFSDCASAISAAAFYTRAEDAARAASVVEGWYHVSRYEARAVRHGNGWLATIEACVTREGNGYERHTASLSMTWTVDDPSTVSEASATMFYNLGRRLAGSWSGAGDAGLRFAAGLE